MQAYSAVAVAEGLSLVLPQSERETEVKNDNYY